VSVELIGIEPNRHQHLWLVARFTTFISDSQCVDHTTRS
jgi:hypothetical protein